MKPSAVVPALLLASLAACNRPALPRLESRVSGVQFVKADAKGAVTLRNVSRRTVLSLNLGTGKDESRLMEINMDAGGLMLPGATYAAHVGPGIRLVTLEAVLFDDGITEGNAEPRIDLEACWLGHEIQRTRILSIGRKILENKALPEAARPAELRRRLIELSEAPDPKSLAGLESRLPNTGRDKSADHQRLSLTAAQFMQFEKTRCLEAVDRMEGKQPYFGIQPPRLSFVEWWQAYVKGERPRPPAIPRP